MSTQALHTFLGSIDVPTFRATVGLQPWNEKFPRGDMGLPPMEAIEANGSVKERALGAGDEERRSRFMYARAWHRVHPLRAEQNV